MQAVLLAAGKGLRMRPLTDTMPKGLLPLDGRPLLEHIMRALPAAVDELFIVVGYRGEAVRDHFGASFDGRPIRYAVQDPVNGTGTAVAFLKNDLHGRFLVVNGDDLYAKGDLERLVAAKDELACLVYPEDRAVPSAAVENGTGQLIGLEERGSPGRPNLRICGAYVLDPSFFDEPLATVSVHGVTEYSLPHTLAALAARRPVAVVKATWWHQVGTPEQYQAAQAAIRVASGS